MQTRATPDTMSTVRTQVPAVGYFSIQSSKPGSTVRSQVCFLSLVQQAVENLSWPNTYEISFPRSGISRVLPQHSSAMPQGPVRTNLRSSIISSTRCCLGGRHFLSMLAPSTETGINEVHRFSQRL